MFDLRKPKNPDQPKAKIFSSTHVQPKTVLEALGPAEVKPKKLRTAFMRLSLKEQIIFIKRLSVLIRAGTPLLVSLQMLKRQTRSKTLLKILDQVTSDVENGQYLATSLAKFRKIFGEFAINIIEIGEISGTLSENLDYLAAELKKSQSLRRKVISSLVYPVFIIFATFGITALLTVFVFPKILPIFRSVNFDLPWTTKVLIFISNLLIAHGWEIILGLIILFILFLFALRNQKFHYWYDKFILKLPIIGDLAQSYNVTSVCRTLGILLRSNVAIVRSVAITSHTSKNLVYRKQMEAVGEKILKGALLSTHFEQFPKLFPPMMTQMIAVAETTGNLSETLLYVADMYEEEVDDLTKNLSTVLEPLLLIFMGVLVGFVAISIITPIYGITQHLNPK